MRTRFWKVIEEVSVNKVNCLFEEMPSFTNILSLRCVSDSTPFEDLVLSVVKKIEAGSETDDEYIAVIRALNFLKFRRDDSIFYEVLDLYELIDHDDDDDELLSNSLSLYLCQVVGEKHVSTLLERLKRYLGDEEDYHEVSHLFELLLKTSFRSDEFLKICLEAFYSPYSDEMTRMTIATDFEHPEILKAIKIRLRFLAPYIKYFPKDSVFHLYRDEWNELGHVLYPNSPNDLRKFDGESDEDFIMEVLGHTDGRSADMILERATKSLPSDEDLTLQRDERLHKMECEFLGPLPDDPLEWLETVPNFIQEQFVDFSNRMAKMNKTRESNLLVETRKKKLVGRNDPCPCGSGKKYKKCHIDKILE